MLFAVVLVLATVHVNGRRVRRCVNINCRSRSARNVISCSSRQIKGNINSVRVVKHHSWWCGRLGWHYKLHSHNKRVFQILGICSGVYRVCFTRASDPYECYYYKKKEIKEIYVGRTKATFRSVCRKNSGIYRRRMLRIPLGCGTCRCCIKRGRRDRRCVNIRCRSRSGRTVVCSRRKIKGNIRLIRVVRRFSSAKCFRGRNYMRSRNKKVLLVRGKCSAVFRVCFARA